jgi:hypothetical protein
MSDALAVRIARILIETSKEIPAREFSKMVDRVFSGSSTAIVAAIANHLPEDLQARVPRKFKH